MSRGITVYGLTTLANGYKPHTYDEDASHFVPVADEKFLECMGDEVIAPDQMWPEDEGGPVIFKDPVHMAEDIVDAGIQAGTLKAGSLNGMLVRPPVSEWPDRWKALKTDDNKE